MALHYREHILPLLPGLRRFAVALIAPQETRSCREADEIVARAVQAVRREGAGLPDTAAWRRSLYAALVRSVQGRSSQAAPPAQKNAIAEGLQALQPQHRAALLLVTLESFSYDEAAVILGVSRTVLIGRLATARQVLARHIEPPAQAAGRQVPHLRLVK